MIYLFLALLSYACTYCLVGLLIQGQLADVAEGLRHRPDAPRIVEVEAGAVKCVLPRQMCRLILALRHPGRCSTCPVARISALKP